MTMINRVLAVALAGFTVITTHVIAQGAPQQTPPPTAPQTPAPPPPDTPAPGRGGRGQGGRGQGGGGMATFPAQQRTLADPEVLAKGKQLFTTNCSPCHGVDLRGGVTGGP